MLYGGSLKQMSLAKTELPKLPDNAFQELMQFVFSADDVTPDALTEDAPQHFIRVHANTLTEAFGRVDISPAMRKQLEQSTWIFSGFKTYHEMKEAVPSLIAEDGSRKTFEQFLNDVQTIDEKYNVNYLRAEYNFATHSAQMAAKWEQIEADGDDYDLQYRTAGDGLVRDEHAALDGITLPPSDPFWEENYPPNGWNCRCTAVQVRKGKYPHSDSKEAMRKGREATDGKHQDMMRFNPGKQRKVFPDYNAYTLAKCATCTRKNTLELAADIPGNELCRACRVVREQARTKDFKEAAREAYTWISENVQEKGYTLPATPDENTHPLRISRGALKDVVDHFKRPEEKMVISSLINRLPERKYTHSAQLGVGKKGDPEVIRKNLEKKRRRKVISYNYYDITIDGETWELNCEVFIDNFEKPYALKRKKR